MSAEDAPFGLPAEDKGRLLARLQNRPRPAPRVESDEPAPRQRAPLGDPTTLRDIKMMRDVGGMLGMESLYFRLHDGRAGAVTQIGGKRFDNFASYDYLGLNGHPRVAQAAKAAIDRFGVSVSGSRLISGEREVHRRLEADLAALYQADDCVVMVSGHATNVTAIGCLIGAEGAVIHDALAHNSIIQGAVLSGARRIAFAHNDLDDLDRALTSARGAKRVLVVVEGHYGMDGDVPDLPRLIRIVRRHGAWLMVDEAHSLGVLGARGHGIAEHHRVDPREVDLWMGTLSKTLSSCGGYVAGSAELVDYLRCVAPGYLYSVGMSPPLAAAATAALEIMREEPERVERLHAGAALFRQACLDAGLDVGGSIGAAIVPVIIGGSLGAAMAADALHKRGINVQPIVYPGVPERMARLRFFISAEHDPEVLRHTAAAVAEVVAELGDDADRVRDIGARLIALNSRPPAGA